jgi:hypothetical protein
MGVRNVFGSLPFEPFEKMVLEDLLDFFIISSIFMIAAAMLFRYQTTGMKLLTRFPLDG